MTACGLRGADNRLLPRLRRRWMGVCAARIRGGGSCEVIMSSEVRVA